MSDPTKLLLVDDHEIFLDGLESLLSSSDQIHIIATALNGKLALEEIGLNLPDVLITDLSMPEMDGIKLVKEVKEKYPEIKILVLSMHDDRETIMQIMMVEAEGYLLKNTGKKELLRAIDRLMDGGTFYSSRVMEIMLERFQQEAKKQEAQTILTDRELEVLQLIAEEKSSREIAENLFISIRTVDTHRKNLLRKTEVHTVIGLLKFGVRNGLISLS